MTMMKYAGGSVMFLGVLLLGYGPKETADLILFDGDVGVLDVQLVPDNQGSREKLYRTMKFIKAETSSIFAKRWRMVCELIRSTPLR